MLWLSLRDRCDGWNLSLGVYLGFGAWTLELFPTSLPTE